MNQMANDIVGKMEELNVDKVCLALGFELIAKLQVANAETEHLIDNLDCGDCELKRQVD